MIRRLSLGLLALLIVAWLAIGAGCAPAGVSKSPFMHVVTRVLTVTTGGATFQSDIDMEGNDIADAGTVTATGFAGPLAGDVSAATITLESVAFSGPVRFGSATVGEGVTQIAHGLGTTPTMMVLTPLYNGTLTQTVYVTSSNTISMYALLSPGSVTQTTVYWAAGK